MHVKNTEDWRSHARPCTQLSSLPTRLIGLLCTLVCASLQVPIEASNWSHDHIEASSTYEQAVERAALATTPEERVLALIDQASTATELNKHAQALEILRQAQSETQENGSLAVAVDARIAAAEIRLGNASAAIPILEGILAGPQSATLGAYAANDLGVARAELDQHDAAIGAFRQAQALATEDRAAYAQALNNELSSRISSKDLDIERLARAAVEAALALPSGPGKSRQCVAVAANLEAMEAQLGFPAAPWRAISLELLDAASDASNGTDQSPRLAANAHGHLSRLYARDNQNEPAVAHAQMAASAANATGDDALIYRWEWHYGVVLLEAGDTQLSREAYGRSVAALNRVRFDLPVSSDAFRQRIAPVYAGYADVLLRSAQTTTDTNAQQELLRDTRSVLEDLKQAEVEDYFANQCVAELSTVEPQLANDTALIYPIILADRLEVVIQTSSSISHAATTVTKRRIEAVARDFRINLQNIQRGDDYLEQAQLIYDWLIRPLRGHLQGVSNIVIVPDGALRTIPMAALHDGDGFLIEQYALSTTPSMRYTKSPETNEQTQMLIGGLAEGVQGFAELPYVADEVGTLAEQFASTLLTDEAFTLEPVQTAMMSPDYNVIHLATHGEFKSDYRESFLLTYDDRLTLGDLQQSLKTRTLQAGADNRLDLLVLSACNTAVGDDRAALGLAGVAIQSGASSAIASLWPVSDPGTAALMTRFYDAMRRGASKSEALRTAQRALLNEPRFEHPLFWAPFTLIGSWQ